MDLLSYLVPARVTSALLTQAVASADMMANKYRAQMPVAVEQAWCETMRPALMQWLRTLTTEETTHVRTPRV